jgi:hypothetical protein
MKVSGFFDFGSAKSSPGDANTWLDKIFQLENYTTKINIAAQLHQAANHGTGSPSVFVAKTLIKDSEDFGQKIPDILQYFAKLVSALSGNELTFQISPNEFRNFGGADVDVRSHVGVLAAHRRLGQKRTGFPRFSGTLFVLCNFERNEAYQSTNNLVFQIHSTPNWPSGDLNRPLIPLACQPNNKILFKNCFHIARPEFQLNMPQLIDGGSGQNVSDAGSSFGGSETEEESEVRVEWSSEHCSLSP